MFKKILLIAIISLIINPLYGAYSEVDCSTNSSFGDYSCDKCFDGGEINTGDNISFLDDIWINETTNNKLVYKEEQDMPIMYNLGESSFTKNPNDDTFWEYTSEFESLLDEDFAGYVLPTGQKISWIKSSLGASFRVDNLGEKGENAGILIFDLISHNILENGEIVMNDKSHKECIIYKSGKQKTDDISIIVENEEKPIIEEEPKPETKDLTKVATGPEEFFVLIIISFLIGMLIINRKTILEMVRK